jgi:hypothetical protein
MGAQSSAAHLLRLVVPAHRAELDPVDRRAHHRCTLAELPWLRDVRLKYGPRAVLIDLSVGGAQLETAGYRLNPGSTVVVELAGDGDGSPIPARVVRCQIAGLAPQPVYRSALEFKRTLVMPETAAPRHGVDANPFHEHARLLLALRRLDRPIPVSAANKPHAPGRFSAAGIDILSAVVAMIDTPAARRAGRAFPRELAALFTIVTQGIEEDATEDALVSGLVERLRRTIPVRAVRVTDTLAVSHRDAIYFDVPLSGDHRAAKLVVELPKDFRFEEWQFQYLRAAAHFFAFVREIGARWAPPPTLASTTGEETPHVEDVSPIASGEVSPVNRVVVRYRDGRLLKGFSRDFLPGRGAVDVRPSSDAPSTAGVTVPFGQLKAIFFVREFDGAATSMAGDTSVIDARGRKIAVTFTDGEQLIGVTLTYKPDGVGFFVRPLDGQNNNTQVFVVSQSIRHVQFP